MPEQLLDTLQLFILRSYTRARRLQQRHQRVYCDATLILSAVEVYSGSIGEEPFLP